MTLDVENLQQRLCTSLCEQVRITVHGKHHFIDAPFQFADGDHYTLLLEQPSADVIRVSDAGHTLMHISYEHDIDKLRKGTRGALLEGLLARHGVSDANGVFFVDTTPEGLGDAVLRLSHALLSITDLTFLNRTRVESTFYEDLEETLRSLVEEDRIQTPYVYSNMENAADYPIDYSITGGRSPLFLFGIPNRDKARLTTIVLEHLLRAKADFESILVFESLGQMPRPDLARLTNVGGEMVASLDAREDLSRKINRRLRQ